MWNEIIVIYTRRNRIIKLLIIEKARKEKTNEMEMLGL